jgi:hypothetical protein
MPKVKAVIFASSGDAQAVVENISALEEVSDIIVHRSGNRVAP